MNALILASDEMPNNAPALERSMAVEAMAAGMRTRH